MKRILVGDDEQNLRILYTRVLTRAGYVVEEAVNGTEAREKVYSGNFDGAVFDNNMGGPRGIDILQDLRKDGRQIPILICSSPLSETDGAEMMGVVERAGNARYLEKPVDMADLEKTSKELFGDPNI